MSTQYTRWPVISSGGSAGVSSLNGLSGSVSLIGGTGITLTVLFNTITIAASGGGSGTVTSVGLTAPSFLTVTGSPITTSGSLALSLTAQTANTFLAAPNGSSGTPTFRTIVAADLPAGTAGINRTITSVSTPTTAGSTALIDYVYLVSGTTTVTLPTAVSNTNLYVIKNISGTTTIATTSAQTIDGSSSATLSVQFTSLSLISDGSNWNIV